MKTFIYKAKDGPDKLIEGKMSANKPEEVVARLSEKGYIATYVEPIDANGVGSEYFLKNIVSISIKELIFFTKELAMFLRSGVPILRALAIISSQVKNRKFGSIIADLSDSVRDGGSLSKSFSGYPRIFSEFYGAMIRAGENSGALDKSLEMLYNYYSKQVEISAKIRSAMIYPVFVLIAGILTVIFVLTNVMPRIMPLLLTMEIKLPLATRMLFGMSIFMQKNLIWLALGFVLFTLIFARALKNKVFMKYFSSFKLALPVVGGIVYKSEIARFTRTLEMSLKNGIPVINAIDISLPVLHEEILKDRLSLSLKGLETGESISKAFEESAILPLFMMDLIKVGEESGRITEALSETADALESDCAEIISNVIVLIEPIMVLVIGLIVAFIVSAVLVPVFNLNVMRV